MPVTIGWSGCSRDSPNSIGGSTTGCVPAWPTRLSPRTRPGTTSPLGWSTPRPGSLANRIRRLAGLVGASPDWHSDVLAELGLLHLLAHAGRRLGSMPGPLADAVATTVGWQVRQADVLAGVPDTDTWIVAARSDTREDRIEVRRHWLRGARPGSGRCCCRSPPTARASTPPSTVGTSIDADLHRYPGPALRALIGARHAEPVEPARPPAVDVMEACGEVGRLLVGEPWLDRVPFTVTASIAVDGATLRAR